MFNVQRLLLVGVLGLVGTNAYSTKPVTDPTWVDGQIYYMIAPHTIPDAITTQPNLYAHAEELYLLVYPQLNPSGTDTQTKTLPSGYQPNCSPCYHPGLPPTFAYHDHVLAGAPGLGKAGTAGNYKGPWKLVLLAYNPAISNRPDFQPITWASEIDAAEAAGVFLPINPDPNAANPYEFEPGAVLICPLVSPHA